MLTPAFEISQTDGFITIIIHARFAKVAETEIFIQDEEFKFYSKPYFLRLNLPGKLLEDGREMARFDVETGTLTARIPKQTPGEHFRGLDMITKLLAPKGNTNAKAPLIEVLDSTEDPSTGGGEAFRDEEEDFDEDFDWQIEQIPYSLEKDPILEESYKYGFANLRSGVFLRLQDELYGVIDLLDPDKTPSQERTERRLREEADKFDGEYYLADLFEDDAIQEILSYEPVWVDEYRRIKSGENPDKIVTLSEDDHQKMKELPNKEYLLDHDQQASVLLGLVDIIYAYAYDNRTTEGESNVESAWTVRKLSATLSWLETFTNLKMVLHSCFQRALSYPLYRHWKLSKKVLRDTVMIFSIGKRRLLKCLLEIHTCLNTSDPYYILNDIYITDYCIWLQGVSEKRLSSLTRSLTKIKVEKEDVGLELIELEEAAQLVQEDERLQNELSAGISTVCLVDKKTGKPGAEKSVNIEKCSDISASREEAVCTKLGALLLDNDTTIQGELESKSSEATLKGEICESGADISGNKTGMNCSSKGTVTCNRELAEGIKHFDVQNLLHCQNDAGVNMRDSDDVSSEDSGSDSSSCGSCSDDDSDEDDDSSASEEGLANVVNSPNLGTSSDLTADSEVKQRQMITVIDSSEKPQCGSI
ncbi:protein SHQ1 homolog [Lineus longissimus]|uniref:protein SHQ1 homolog n=1 Tax=Lineus longissimus TaxID=88925 RepID=UPI002B4E723A